LLGVGWSESGGRGYPQIGFSNRKAAASVTHHLLDLGHRHIGVIIAGQASNDRASERLAGIRQVLGEADIELAEKDIFRCDFTFENGALGLRRFLDRPDPPTAVLCGSDMLAAGALFECQRLGINVPQEMSLTGFDDIELARMVHPALTTMRTPRRDLAKVTAESLLSLLLDGKALPSLQFDTQLMVRESTAAPRQHALPQLQPVDGHPVISE
ncbi:MAG: substrate-binding domain-containing protein, partial [Rhizobiaceae bacterium]